MPKDFKRTDRVAATLQRELAQVIRQELKDPRILMFSITTVEVSRDLSYAKIYVTFLEKDVEKIKISLQLINKAVGFIRSELGKRVKLRIVPNLKFVEDVVIQHGERLSSLIENLQVPPDEERN